MVWMQAIYNIRTTSIICMTRTTKTSKKNVIQIRYEKETTRTDFLEVRAHFPNHEETIVALVQFWKKYNKPVMKGSIT